MKKYENIKWNVVWCKRMKNLIVFFIYLFISREGNAYFKTNAYNWIFNEKKLAVLSTAYTYLIQNSILLKLLQWQMIKQTNFEN